MARSRVQLVVRAVLVLAGALPFISWALSLADLPPFRSLDAWFGLQCHGLLDRTLALGGRYFPVCSRCLGIYGGLLGAGLLALPTHPWVDARKRRFWIVAAAAFMVLEVLVQDLSAHPPYHLLRMLTGILLAWPIALTLIDAADDSAAGSRAAR